ncbi:MAG: YitT family protein, partial [Oscillospiraceae bacterium]
NHFAFGGTSGLSIILSSLVKGLDIGGAMLLVNIVLIVIGFIFLGKQVIGLTIYSSLAVSFFIGFFTRLLPLTKPLTNDTMLELLYAVALPAVGSAIAFNIGASTGGTDIIAMILSKYVKIEIGKALFFSDLLITIAAGAVFGIKVGLYCLLGLLIKSFMIDGVIEAFNKRKMLTIITGKTEEIKEYIINVLRRGATMQKAQGAYLKEEKDIIMTIVSNRQAVLLRNYIREIDPDAFISIVNTSETVGRGFREI